MKMTETEQFDTTQATTDQELIKGIVCKLIFNSE